MKNSSVIIGRRRKRKVFPKCQNVSFEHFLEFKFISEIAVAFLWICAHSWSNYKKMHISSIPKAKAKEFLRNYRKSHTVETLRWLKLIDRGLTLQKTCNRWFEHSKGSFPTKSWHSWGSRLPLHSSRILRLFLKTTIWLFIAEIRFKQRLQRICHACFQQNN